MVSFWPPQCGDNMERYKNLYEKQKLEETGYNELYNGVIKYLDTFARYKRSHIEIPKMMAKVLADAVYDWIGNEELEGRRIDLSGKQFNINLAKYLMKG